MKYRSNMTEAYRKVLERLNEAPNDDAEEKDMAIGQLEFIKYAADEIKQYVKRDGLEEWFQNKLSGAHSTMKDLHSYIEGEEGKKGMNDQKEEVDLTEAVELEKDKVDMIKGFTDRNQHYDARAFICQMMKDSRLKSIYSEVGALQDKYNKELGFLLSRGVRDQLDKTVLLPKLKREFKNWQEIYSSI